jgi:malate dehydrogenase
VSVLGASGGIGQPLALLLKLDPRVSELALFDVVRTPGVASDISHCDTYAKVTGYVGKLRIYIQTTLSFYTNTNTDTNFTVLD